jgi:hypothetical protein
MSMRGFSVVLLAVAVAFGAGWLLGASGRSTLEQERDYHLLRSQVLEAETLMLAARVSLFETNFGEAGERLDRALDLVTVVQTRLRERGEAERAGRLEVVAGRIRDASQLARQFDGAAQGSIDAAIDGLRGAIPAPPSAADAVS